MIRDLINYFFHFRFQPTIFRLSHSLTFEFPSILSPRSGVCGVRRVHRRAGNLRLGAGGRRSLSENGPRGRETAQRGGRRIYIRIRLDLIVFGLVTIRVRVGTRRRRGQARAGGGCASNGAVCRRHDARLCVVLE